MDREVSSLQERLRRFSPDLIPELPDSEKWKESSIVVCGECASPALFHPHDDEILGCAHCGYAVGGFAIYAFFVPCASDRGRKKES